jgi:hypothetical protein
MFLTPIRNMYSSVFEMAGLRSYIGKTEKFTRLPISDRINITRGVGVRYIIVADPDVQKELSTSTEVIRKGVFGSRKLYEIQKYQPMHNALSYLPHLVFTPINFKARPAYEFNFTSFNEQLLLNRFYPEVLLARDPQRTIDQISDTDLYHFSSLTFTEYQYTDLKTAVQKIADFSKTRPVHAVEVNDPLFIAIRMLTSSRPNIHIYQLGGGKRDSTITTNATLKNIFTNMAKYQIKSDPITPEIPYYIRQTYFPWWHRVDNKPLYTVSPFYTLTFISSEKIEDIETLLVFNADISVYLGYMIAGITLSTVGYIEIRNFRKRRRKSSIKI